MTTQQTSEDATMKLALFCDAWQRASTMAFRARKWGRWRKACDRLKIAEARYSAAHQPYYENN